MPEIELKALVSHEFPDLFAHVKRGIFADVEAVFGWDDDFQRERIATAYRPEWFYWLLVDQQRVGLICFKLSQRAYHLHLLIVFDAFQGRGFGKRAMQFLQQQAEQQKLESISLSCFKRNVSVVRFYQDLGYQVIVEETDFLSMRWKASSAQSSS